MPLASTTYVQVFKKKKERKKERKNMRSKSFQKDKAILKKKRKALIIKIMKYHCFALF